MTRLSSDPVVPIYVINLDRDIARLQFLPTLFSRHGLSFERVEAVDGRRLSQQHGPEIVPVRPSPRETAARLRDHAAVARPACPALTATHAQIRAISRRCRRDSGSRWTKRGRETNQCDPCRPDISGPSCH
jgi:Glycosyltransferase family 25 (LPS biosynthesis protein)